MDKTGWLAIVATFFLMVGVAQAQENPTVLIITISVLLLAVVFLFSQQKQKKIQSKARLQLLSELLNNLSENLGKSEIDGFTLEKGEIPIYKINKIALTEYRSSGSSYVGGSQGVSVRIAKGLSYKVGASRGQLLKIPETLTLIDEGSAIFTSKRIVFVGQNVNREWEFSKLLQADSGPNGIYINLAVSNRQKNSGLQTIDETELTPGLVAAISIDAFENSIKSAANVAKDYAVQLSDVAKEVVK